MRDTIAIVLSGTVKIAGTYRPPGETVAVEEAQAREILAAGFGMIPVGAGETKAASAKAAKDK